MKRLVSNLAHRLMLNTFIRQFLTATVAALVLIAAPILTMGQSTTTTIWGDVKVDESKLDKLRPLTFMIIIYSTGGVVLDRTTATAGGRYRFSVKPGEYDLSVEHGAVEIARMRIVLSGVPGGDYRQDLEFAVTPEMVAAPKAATISAADSYKRTGENESVFKKAQSALDAKRYEDASALFLQVVNKDDQDFQAWTELGTVYLLLKKGAEAENAYVKATQIRPNFALANLNLGRLRIADKKYQEAIGPLTKVVELQPTSAEGNYLLGEAYLQTKKGSMAVTYLTEAGRLGKAEAHLRLATLYNAVGMKDKASLEYEEYLKKKPDTPDRKKLEQYIEANKPKANP